MKNNVLSKLDLFIYGKFGKASVMQGTKDIMNKQPASCEKNSDNPNVNSPVGLPGDRFYVNHTIINQLGEFLRPEGTVFCFNNKLTLSVKAEHSQNSNKYHLTLKILYMDERFRYKRESKIFRKANITIASAFCPELRCLSGSLRLYLYGNEVENDGTIIKGTLAINQMQEMFSALFDWSLNWEGWKGEKDENKS